MIELSFEMFSQVISFFDKNTLNFPVVMSVIEGNNPGRIWVDQLENPSICLVMTNEGYSFIGKRGKIKEFLILEAIEIFNKNKPIKLICEIDDPLKNIVVKDMQQLLGLFLLKNLYQETCNRQRVVMQVILVLQKCQRNWDLKKKNGICFW